MMAERTVDLRESLRTVKEVDCRFIISKMEELKRRGTIRTVKEMENGRNMMRKEI